MVRHSSGLLLFAPQLLYPVVLGQDMPILLDLLPKAKPCNIVVTRSTSSLEGFNALPFHGEEIEAEQEKSRWERRLDKMKGSVSDKGSSLPEPGMGLDVTTVYQWTLGLCRRVTTLQPWFKRVSVVDGVKQGSADCLEEEKYILENGILYQVKGGVEVLAVPASLRPMVMSLAHSVQWAGHLGKHKTLARITSRFYWPCCIQT